MPIDLVILGKGGLNIGKWPVMVVGGWSVGRVGGTLEPPRPPLGRTRELWKETATQDKSFDGPRHAARSGQSIAEKEQV